MVNTSLLWLVVAITGLFQSAVGDIPYPPNAAAGATIVAVLSLDSGAVRRVDIATGADPFASAVRSSVEQWRLPDERGKRTVTLVVQYREPGLLGLGDPIHPVAAPSSPIGGLPYPKAITQPSYPPNSLGAGSVVLRVGISPSGAIQKAETVKGLGSLTDAARDAVRSWSFVPARDRAGHPVASDAYVAFVFRAPVLTGPAPRR